MKRARDNNFFGSGNPPAAPVPEPPEVECPKCTGKGIEAKPFSQDELNAMFASLPD